jgi:hypothetical protein
MLCLESDHLACSLELRSGTLCDTDTWTAIISRVLYHTGYIVERQLEGDQKTIMPQAHTVFLRDAGRRPVCEVADHRITLHSRNMAPVIVVSLAHSHQ